MLNYNMQYKDIEYNFRIVLAGDSGVGKTNLIGRYTCNEFSFDTKSTIGTQYSTKSLVIDSRSVICQIWDTAGQEKFQSITKIYFREAVGALVVYDVCNEKTFNSTQNWVNSIRELADPDVVIVLVGNKSDLNNLRTIQCEEAQAFAQKNKIEFIETSALTGENVELAFESLSKKIYFLKQEKEKKNTMGNSLQNQNEKNQKKVISLKNISSEKKKNCC